MRFKSKYPADLSGLQFTYLTPKKFVRRVNVVTCCEWCNRMKLDHSYDEFIDKIKVIYNHLLGENNENV